MSLEALAHQAWKPASLFEKFKVICWDLETTGKSIKEARVVQIGATSHCGATFVRLVNPRCRIPFLASRVHGITTQRVSDAPEFPSAWQSFMEFVRDVASKDTAQEQRPVLLVGHNSWTYDENVVHLELLRFGLSESELHKPPPGSLSADTLRAGQGAKKNLVFSKGTPLNLTSLHNLFYAGDELMRNAHDALTDATAVLKILRKDEIQRHLQPRAWLQQHLQDAEQRAPPAAPQGVEEAQPVVSLVREGSVEQLAAPAPGQSASRPPAAGEARAAATEEPEPARKKRVTSALVSDASRLPVCEECQCAFSLHFHHECLGPRRRSPGALGAGGGKWMPADGWWQQFEWQDPSEKPRV